VADAGNPSLRRVSDGRALRWKLLVWPWQSMVLSAVIGVAFIAQFFVAGGPTPAWLGLSAAALAAGRWYTLLTHIFIHAGPWHLWMNLSALGGLSDQVCARMGRSPRAALVFFAFFLVCGVLAGLGYLVAHPSGAVPAVGASGAICGLWGAAARLVGQEAGLSGLWSPIVRANVVSLVKSNLFLVILFVLLGLLPGGGGVRIAWEAHLAGFVAGLLLIGPFLRLAAGTEHRPIPTQGV
jgi:membrane associated rhomboid family serine protease